MQQGSAPTTLRESCIRTLARCLHTVSTQRFVSIVWPEECLLELLQARVLLLAAPSSASQPRARRRLLTLRLGRRADHSPARPPQRAFRGFVPGSSERAPGSCCAAGGAELASCASQSGRRPTLAGTTPAPVLSSESTHHQYTQLVTHCLCACFVSPSRLLVLAPARLRPPRKGPQPPSRALKVHKVHNR